MEKDVAKILITEERLQERIRELGRELSCDYEGKNPILVCVLKGGILFLADLVRNITIPHEIDFMAISSYGNSTESSGIVRILKDLDANISGRHVVIVEDIIDTGHTLEYILRNLSTRDPASLRICALLSKPERREVEVPLNYVGFEIPNVFVIGYGLDFGELYRNLRYIGVLKPDLYES